MNDTKACTRCGIELNVSMFTKDISRASGLNCHCKECASKFALESRAKYKLRKIEPRTEGTKFCSKCKLEFDVIFFGKSISSSDGLRGECKKCRREESKIYADSNREKEKERAKIYRAENKDEIRKRHKIYRLANKDKIKERSKRDIKNRGSAYKIYKQNYDLSHKKEIKGIQKKYSIDLTDSYIRHNLVALGFPKESIKQFPEIIEVKRLLIKTKRLCKTLQI